MKENIKSSLSKADAFKIIGIVLFLIAIVLVAWFFMYGERTVTGNFNEDSKETTMACKGNDLVYPFFGDDSSVPSTTAVNAIFDTDGVRSIALSHTMRYNDEAEASAKTALHNAAMNISFGENGFNADAFSATYTINKNEARVNLYATKSQLSDISAKYFLLEDFSIASPASQYEEYYQKYGFKCELSE